MLDIETRVYSRIKNKFPQELRDRFPEAFFTRDDRLRDNSKFPTVYVHELSSVERGQDLQNQEIHAVLSTIQVEVYDNDTRDNANTMMDYVVGVMKSMRYNVISMPEFQNNEDVYRVVARFRRIIGSLDTL